MITKLGLYFHTLRFLKPIQVYYRLYYSVLGKIGANKIDFSKVYNQKPIFLSQQITWSKHSYQAPNNFTFLQISHTFSEEINWELMTYGKLWQYNLAYFDYLNQPELSQTEGLFLIHDFIKKGHLLQSALEPYPSSLRIINWIKFISKHQITDSLIVDSLYAQTSLLSKRIEYHLLGNHLLENAFALLHAGLFFQEECFFIKAKKILKIEFEEQILADGGHFELSPMYHQILLYRVLEATDLLQQNSDEDDLIAFLRIKASKMLGWLQATTFSDGSMALLNDSTINIAPDLVTLQKMARLLNIKSEELLLSESGYRMFKRNTFELLMDIDGISPSYQPGHAHADTFNLLLTIGNQAILVDTGISTYQVNQRRQLERSTSSHNTVTINDQNQSKVWGGFRVAQRAKTTLLEESSANLIAQHDGYSSLGIIHQRTLTIADKHFEVTDELIGSRLSGKAHWHFDASIQLTLNQNEVNFGLGTIQVEGHENIVIEAYQQAIGFNTLVTAQKLVIIFNKSLKTTFSVHDK